MRSGVRLVTFAGVDRPEAVTYELDGEVAAVNRMVCGGIGEIYRKRERPITSLVVLGTEALAPPSP